jgi:hypothetical protein
VNSRTATVLLAVISIAAALAGCSHAVPRPASSSAPVPTTAAAPPLANVEVFSRTFQLAPSGSLPQPETVRLPLTQAVPQGWAVIVATAETGAGPWSYLSAALTSDHRAVTFTTGHHSIFTVIGVKLGDLLGFFKKQFLDGLSSGATASATPPSCSREPDARSGYTIRSSAGPTLYWCFGMDSTGQRVLRVVNNRPYPLEIKHPGLAVVERPAVDIGAWASVSRLVSGQESILAPGALIGYRASPAPGQSGGIQTSMDGFGQSLFALQTGINSLLDILTRFGAGSGSKSTDVLQKALEAPACAQAMLDGNSGAILTSCLDPAEMAEYFGTVGVLLAPLAAAGGLASFFNSEFQGLHDVWTKEDRYSVTIENTGTGPQTGSPAGPGGATAGGGSAGQSVAGPGVAALSCASAAFCMAADTAGNAYRYSGGSWSQPQPVDSGGLSGVSCPAPGFCIAVSHTNNLYTYSAGTWSPAVQLVGADGNPANLTAVSCPTSSFCMATGAWDAYQYSGTGWSQGVLVQDTDTFTALSCASAAFCMAADSSGKIFTHGTT